MEKIFYHIHNMTKAIRKRIIGNNITHNMSMCSRNLINCFLSETYWTLLDVRTSLTLKIIYKIKLHRNTITHPFILLIR